MSDGLSEPGDHHVLRGAGLGARPHCERAGGAGLGAARARWRATAPGEWRRTCRPRWAVSRAGSSCSMSPSRADRRRVTLGRVLRSEPGRRSGRRRCLVRAVAGRSRGDGIGRAGRLWWPPALRRGRSWGAGCPTSSADRAVLAGAGARRSGQPARTIWPPGCSKWSCTATTWWPACRAGRCPSPRAGAWRRAWRSASSWPASASGALARAAGLHPGRAGGARRPACPLTGAPGWTVRPAPCPGSCAGRGSRRGR